MSAIIIRGGRPLSGSLTVQGAKNSVLPILAATLLSGEVCRIRHCPRLRDVETAMEILRHLGCRADWQGRDLLVDAADLTRWDVPDHLMSRMRSSVVFLGAILARCGQAEMTYPGGCELGARPIDLHLAALRSMGAAIQETGGRLACRRERLTGTEIVLSLPSVGATENAMLAACGAEGTTVIANAAREPEIVDLQTFLQKMGAHVQGAGSSTVVVEGGAPLHGCVHTVVADRIVAATYLAAAAGTGGDIRLEGVDYRHLSAVATMLRQAGCRLTCGETSIRLQAPRRLQSAHGSVSRLSHGRTGGADGVAAAIGGSHRLCGEHLRQPLPPCAGDGADGSGYPTGGPGGRGMRRRPAPRSRCPGQGAAGRRIAGAGGPSGGGRDRRHRRGAHSTRI